MLPKIVRCGNKSCRIPKSGWPELYAHSLLFNNLKGMSGVTSYIYTVTLGILKEYAPELALLAAYYRILLTVTFQRNNDRYRVHSRPSLSGVRPDVRTLNCWCDYPISGRACEQGHAQFENCARFGTRFFPLPLTSVGANGTVRSDVRTDFRRIDLRIRNPRLWRKV
jgi:hypothetical protein